VGFDACPYGQPATGYVKETWQHLHNDGSPLERLPDSWPRWIVPIPMLGFQGWRYARWNSESPLHLAAETNGSGGRKLYLIEEVGGWLDPMPADPSRACL
jgi:hypothetical protein